MTEPIVSVRNVSRFYPGGVTAVDHVSLDIAQNEFFALLGPIRLRQDHASPHDLRPRHAK